MYIALVKPYLILRVLLFMGKALLRFDDKGIYCEQGDFYIDPWRPVDYAVISHAHADHASWGHKHYLAHDLSREVLKYRLGDIDLECLAYGQQIYRKGVSISLFPAGHVPGSSQIRVEYKGEVWVASGDYKTEDDGLSTAFEPLRCHSFISESTFGMPVYRWKMQQEVMGEINGWWATNAGNSVTSFITGYSLGKAQRILQGLNQDIGPVFVHGTIANTNAALERNGLVLAPYKLISADMDRDLLRGAIVICPPSSADSSWMKKHQPYSLAFCSGWMAIRGAKRRRAVDKGFVLSDHADWAGLVSAIKATHCEQVILTHGYTAAFSRYLQGLGLNAQEAHTAYGDEHETEGEQS